MTATAPTVFGCGHPKTPENTAPNGRHRTTCRACKQARSRARIAANPDGERARTRAAMRRHRGGLKGHRNSQKTHCPAGHEYGPETTYEYRGARQCKPCRKQRAAEWRAANPERLAQQQHRSYVNNRETRLSDKRRWRAENREESNLASRLKKQRRRAAGTLTAADWAAILDRYGHACLACGANGPLTVDHVVPIFSGGRNTPDNVQPLCGPCNSRKGTKTIDYRPMPVGSQRS